MNEIIIGIFHLAILLLGPIFFTGLINRTKAILGGRKGPKIYQTYFDLKKLLSKKPVYSVVSTFILRSGSSAVLASVLLAGLIAPIFPKYSIFHFSYDFIFFAYFLAVGRFFLILSALDTGSPFEGMGASRESTFGTLMEPAFFILVSTFGVFVGRTSFQNLFEISGPFSFVISSLIVGLLVLMLLTESGRVPVDDPTTHLELTMIHEVMILDHSAYDLAFMIYSAGIKMTIGFGLMASFLNPFSLSQAPLLAIGTSLLIMSLGAIFVGFVESIMARMRMSLIPYFIIGGSILSSLVFLLLSFEKF